MDDTTLEAETKDLAQRLFANLMEYLQKGGACIASSPDW